MKRTMIDYGIDLGTTNSAISRREGGEFKIVKSLDTQKDTTPSCVAFNRKGATSVGDSAYHTFLLDSGRAMKSGNAKFNSFIEYKRTMGTDATYHSSYLDKDFSSEELSAEVLKHLRNYVQDESIESAVITIPAGYTANQVDAVKRAGELAGFSYVETLQEPVAAAMAYGIEGNNNGYWLVFDFGGGTFDSALIKVDEGIVKVIDTEGDNYLGGKDLDFAIVDNLIIPHIKQEFEIDEMMSNSKTRASFRNAFKRFAEDIKNNLSFRDSYELYMDPGDCGEDDNGDEFEIDLIVSREDLKPVFEPIVQRAIDLALTLLSRNNVKSSDLASLILVGGPTLSPIIRNMVSEQICQPDTSVDPMTVVSRGAAIYASTRPLPSLVTDQIRDTSQVQLNIDFEPSSVELDEFVTIKLASDKMDAALDTVSIQLKRADNVWMSVKTDVDSSGEIFDVLLAAGKVNTFEVIAFDRRGNRVEVQPTSFNIIQGSVLGSMTLTHNFGVETFNIASESAEFTALKGLEKNKSLPAKGTYQALKTQSDIRPGIKSDVIRIPIYQGETDAVGTRAIHNEHLYDFVITGEDIPALLPAQSIINLTINIDESQTVSVEAEIPMLNYTLEVEVPTETVQSAKTEWIQEQISKARSELSGESDLDSDLHDQLNEAERSLSSSDGSVDAQMQARNKIREVLRRVDAIKSGSEWNYVDSMIKPALERCRVANSDIGDEQTTRQLQELETNYSLIQQNQDVKLGRELVKQLNDLHFEITKFYQYVHFIRDSDSNFNSVNWKDRFEARSAVDNAMNALDSVRTFEELRPYIVAVFDLMPEQQQTLGRSQYDNTLLIS